MRYLLYIVVCLLLVIGCKKKSDNIIESTESVNSSDSNDTALVIDVRTEQEYSAGHIEGAINIPYTEIANKIENYTNDNNQKILLYCRSGARSSVALKTLNNIGYTNVENIGSYAEAKAYLGK